MLNMKEYIRRIQLESKNRKYDDYVHIFEEYKSYLEGYIKENPKDIEAICQLAAVCFELRYGEQNSINIMEKFLCSAAGEMGAADTARVCTNLAFFCEKSYESEKQLYYLKKAVTQNVDYPNAYDALGRFYIENECPDNAIALFEKAISLSGNVKYRYNYGVALFCSGNIPEAKAVFEKLLDNNSEERRLHYAYGACCFYTGDIAKAIQLADVLHLSGYDDYITESELADLYFLCGEYAKHNEMYDGEPYAMEERWLAPYFYGLKALGDVAKLEKTFADVVSTKNREIAQEKTEELDEDYTEANREEYIQFMQKEKQDISDAYDKIKDGDYKPEIKIKLWFMYGCYLIDCPRHQSLI